MKIATDNKVAHYQIEMNETNEQLAMLQSQYNVQAQRVSQMQQYLSVNNGDSRTRQMYRKESKDLSSLATKIRQKKRHILTLQRQLMIEQNKISRRR